MSDIKITDMATLIALMKLEEPMALVAQYQRERDEAQAQVARLHAYFIKFHNITFWPVEDCAEAFDRLAEITRLCRRALDETEREP